MAANMSEEKFLIIVADIIGREFESEVNVINIMKDEYLITFKEYSTILSKGMIKQLKGPIGPYRADRYILNDFIIQGFELDKMRSQYIKYVFGIFKDKGISK